VIPKGLHPAFPFPLALLRAWPPSLLRLLWKMAFRKSYQAPNAGVHTHSFFCAKKRMDPMGMYVQKKAYMVIIFLVLLGSINWLVVGATGQDLVRLALPPRYARWVYIVIGLAALALFFTRDIYLPFLGETLVPAGALTTKAPQNANDQVTVRTVPGAKVLYWTTEPNPTEGKEAASWDVAYGGYENSGVAEADAGGTAVLRFRGPPQSYRVPMKGVLRPHVHFRVCDAHGFMGPVQTLFVESGAIEGFSELL
jgi:uncharacterized membrane protein YuzA (DUF378 family)